MVGKILIWFIAIVFVEAVVEIEVESELFKAIRGKLIPNEARKGFLRFIMWYINGLFSCGYCLSVWVSAVTALFIPTQIIGDCLLVGIDNQTATKIIGYLICVFVLHRASNIWHELVHRWTERMPYIMAFRPTSDFVLPGGINGTIEGNSRHQVEERIGTEATSDEFHAREQEPRPNDTD